MSKEMIATVLKARRKALNLKIEDVVGKLGSAGIVITPKTLYGYEAGHRQPDADTLLALCDIYQITNILEAFSGETTKPASVSADGLSPAEAGLIELFRMVPDENREMVLHMIEAALKSQGLL